MVFVFVYPYLRPFCILYSGDTCFYVQRLLST